MEHEPKLYCSEGPITSRDGKFTVAFLGCTCGWNSDGKAAEKESWSAHIVDSRLWRISQAVKLHNQNDFAGLQQFYDYVKGVVSKPEVK